MDNSHEKPGSVLGADALVATVTLALACDMLPLKGERQTCRSKAACGTCGQGHLFWVILILHTNGIHVAYKNTACCADGMHA